MTSHHLENIVPTMNTSQSSFAPPWGTARATQIAESIIKLQVIADGDADRAMRTIERRYAIGYWTLWHLARGKAKSCSVDLFGKLLAAYIDICSRQVDRLQSEIAKQKALGDDTLDDLETEALALAARIAARKAALS